MRALGIFVAGLVLVLISLGTANREARADFIIDTDPGEFKLYNSAEALTASAAKRMVVR